MTTPPQPPLSPLPPALPEAQPLQQPLQQPLHRPLAAATTKRQQLSSLLDADWDGLPSGDVAGVLASWRQDAEARETWHAYHLIGDVMRSDDLAQPVYKDQAFLRRLRTRLDTEPVHLVSPAAAAQPVQLASSAAPSAHNLSRRLGRWQAGAALAASVAVVSVALLVSQVRGPALEAGAPALADGGNLAGSAAPGAMVNTAGVLRDPRLDEFLRLHQMARGGLPMGAPGGSLQRADLQMPADVAR